LGVPESRLLVYKGFLFFTYGRRNASNGVEPFSASWVGLLRIFADKQAGQGKTSN